MRRRLVLWSLVAALGLGTLTACGGGGENEDGNNPVAPQNENGDGEDD